MAQAVNKAYCPFESAVKRAQGYLDSHLDQSMRSFRGAVGVMQLLPSQ